MRLTTRTRFSLLLTALLAPALGQAGTLPPLDADWHLQKKADGIRIYTTEVRGSDFEAFKAVADLDVSMAELMAVMINPQSCLEWVHNCSVSEAFGDGNFYDRYAYSVNDMPWPVQDRDYVLRIRTHGDQHSGVVEMDLNAVPDARPEADNYVRVDKSDTLYRFEPLGPERTRMTWVQHTEPNGDIPSWLVNSLVVDIPVKSMLSLQKVAHKPRYAGFQLEYNDQGKLVGVIKSGHAEGDED